MTICTNVLTNYVPAVAAIRKRLVLIILNGFKGYSDGKIRLNKGTIFLEFNKRRSYFRCIEIKFVDT